MLPVLFASNEMLQERTTGLTSWAAVSSITRLGPTRSSSHLLSSLRNSAKLLRFRSDLSRFALFIITHLGENLYHHLRVAVNIPSVPKYPGTAVTSGGQPLRDQQVLECLVLEHSI